MFIKKRQLFKVRKMLTIIRNKNEYLQSHSKRVCQLAIMLAEHLGLSQQEIRIIKYGALLHDLGKVQVDNLILNKPGCLNGLEFEIIKRHPIFGTEMLQEHLNNKEILDIISYHHERWDGNGYPYKLRGEEIPVAARIVSIVDAFDAMTTVRPYHKVPFTIKEALEEILDNAGSQFDKEIAMAFCQKISEER